VNITFFISISNLQEALITNLIDLLFCVTVRNYG